MLYFTGVWTELMTKLKAWTQTFNKIHVITGPLFDYNYDGLWDSAPVSGYVPHP